LDSATYNAVLANQNNVLKQNVVDMEYHVSQSQAMDSLTGFRGYQFNKDDLGVVYKVKLSSNVDVSHEVSLGLQSLDNSSGHFGGIGKNDSLTDSLTQKQTSRITYYANDQMKLSFYNTISSDVQNASSDFSNQLEYGTRLEWKVTPRTTLAPQLSQSTSWTTDNSVVQNQRAAFSLQQDVYKNAVSLVFTPSVAQENESWTGYNQSQSERALDSSLKLNLSRNASISVGNRLESVDRMLDYAEVAAQRYYIEWQQQAAKDLSFRVRSEYALKDTYLDPTPGNSYEENTVRFIFGPKVSISDTLTANAEFQYVVEQAVSQVAPTTASEKIVSVSLKHSF
jgi:hypothetical protein